MKFSNEAIVVIILVAVAAFVIGRETAQPTGPSNTNDCILDGLKNGGHDRMAAAMVEAACMRKFGAP